MNTISVLLLCCGELFLLPFPEYAKYNNIYIFNWYVRTTSVYLFSRSVKAHSKDSQIVAFSFM